MTRSIPKPNKTKTNSRQRKPRGQRTRKPSQAVLPEISHGIMGSHPLTPGEDEAEFQRFYERITESVSPNDAIEQLLVEDIVLLSWDAWQYRRYKISLIASMQRRSLIETTSSDDADKLLPLFDAMTAGDAKSRIEFERLARKKGIDMDEMVTKRFELRDNSYSCKIWYDNSRFRLLIEIERLIECAETRRNRTLRELHRYREALARQLESALNDVEDAEFEDLELPISEAAE